MSGLQSPFRLNVGFIAHQSVGFSRDFPLDFENIHLPPDLDIIRLKGKVSISRTPQGLLVQPTFEASIPGQCARCLDDLQLHLEVTFAELYAFSKKSTTEAGLLFPENGKIDLTPLIREFILLEVPINPLCRPDCEGLCSICGERLDADHISHEDNDIDPRLEILKSLL